jgi:arylsulfatase A-like enzyme
VESIDVFPTIMDLCGMERIEIGNMDQCQGKSILKEYKNKTALIENSSQDRQKIIHLNWSYIYHNRNGRQELYDLSQDPFEKNNLADGQNIVVKKMHRLLLQKINDSMALSQKISPEDAEIDKRVLEVLKSLGYIK